MSKKGCQCAECQWCESEMKTHKVDPMKSFIKNEKTGCWEWTRSLINGFGYCGKKKPLAHRWFYEKFVGPIPERTRLDHICKNRLCVNSGHLQIKPLLMTDRATHWRSAKMKKGVTECEWKHLGGCSKAKLHTAHIDQNPFNNDLSNLKKLCPSHHFLFDRGAINLSSTSTPEFYIDESGRRRYYFKLQRDMENRAKRTGSKMRGNGWTIKGRAIVIRRKHK